MFVKVRVKIPTTATTARQRELLRELRDALPVDNKPRLVAQARRKQ
jgi:hypothetical protein